MEKLNTVYFSLGSNIEDRYDFLLKACNALNEVVQIQDVSPIYETAPLGFTAECDFLNLAINCVTDLKPEALLNKINDIERDLGRRRNKDNSYTSRVIDIDIIFYNNLIIKTKTLSIPHPRYKTRNFVLQPLADLYPNMCDPETKETISELLNRSNDNSSIMQWGMSINTDELI